MALTNKSSRKIVGVEKEESRRRKENKRRIDERNISKT